MSSRRVWKILRDGDGRRVLVPGESDVVVSRSRDGVVMVRDFTPLVPGVYTSLRHHERRAQLYIGGVTTWDAGAGLWTWSTRADARRHLRQLRNGDKQRAKSRR